MAGCVRAELVQLYSALDKHEIMLASQYFSRAKYNVEEYENVLTKLLEIELKV